MRRVLLPLALVSMAFAPAPLRAEARVGSRRREGTARLLACRGRRRGHVQG